MNDWVMILLQVVQDYLDGYCLDEVECIIVDMFGIVCGKVVLVSKFVCQDYFYLFDSIFYQMIIGEWGEVVGEEGFIECDMMFKLDMIIISVVFWMNDWILQVIYDVFDCKGELVEFVFCNVLKCVVGLFEVEGWKLVVVLEMEFFLVVCNVDFGKKIELMMGCLGWLVVVCQVYLMIVVDEFGFVIDDIYDFVEVQGFEIDGII